MSELRHIGLIGCGVMGQNLALNMERNGFSVAVFDSDAKKVEAYLAGKAAGKAIGAVRSLEELVAELAKPRRILMMVPAGRAVDDCIESLLPLLEPEDILIDGGNSHHPDTTRRTRRLAERGFRYVGTGVSGGEEGALNGPSLMPGGSPEAWPHVRPIFEAICARTEGGDPCCRWVGEEGAGHFVKMVHNGIEYADMQLIGEVYQVLKTGLELPNREISAIFGEWNEGELGSYLIEITRDILAFQDENGEATLDAILDTAGQKGTGKWTVIEGLNLGRPVSLIGEAVFARCLSALKEERVAASEFLEGPSARIAHASGRELIKALRHALYASKIVAYAQGFLLMRAAAEEHGWNLDYAGIASLWREGCIIRSAFLDPIRRAYELDPKLSNLVLASPFREALGAAQRPWRLVIATATARGIPIPAMSSALAFYDGYRTARLPANLLQAQRDYFGAHTYERLDRPRGECFHSVWKR